MNQKTLEDVIKTVRVSVVADVCGVSQRAIYKWMDNAECNARGVTKSAIDRITFMAGFADALIQVGWLVETNGVLSLPNFERHNGKSSKKRAVTNERVTKIRELKRKGNAASVTKTDQKALPEEEKEEDINTYLPLNPPRQKRASKKFEPEAIELPDWLPETLWHEWVQFRQALRKPIRTEQGANGAIRELEKFRQIIDRRTASMRSVGMLTNLNYEAMKTLLGERIMDRMTMNGGRWVNFNWESWRPNVVQPGIAK